MPLRPATASFSDAAFLSALDHLELPLDHFRHHDHLRLAWLELHSKPFPAAVQSVRVKIQRFGAHHQKSHIYHETITVAWVSLLASHSEPTFSDFLRDNDGRLNAALLHTFWSPERLASDAARHAWLAPDIRPLPEITTRGKVSE
jgi:hypothetical protein